MRGCRGCAERTAEGALSVLLRGAEGVLMVPLRGPLLMLPRVPMRGCCGCIECAI